MAFGDFICLHKNTHNSIVVCVIDARYPLGLNVCGQFLGMAFSFFSFIAAPLIVLPFGQDKNF